MITAKVGQLLKTIPCQCQLGEGVLWHVEQQAIYWLDIEGATLYRHYVNQDLLETFSLPQRIGCFAFTPKSDEIIAAFAQGVARYHLKKSTLQWLSQPELDITGNRFNDGKADRQGRFWAGTMVENQLSIKQQAHLYCIDHQLNCHKAINSLSISNGLCWNKAGDILFHADSPEHKIYQYSFCQKTATLSNKRLFASTHTSAFPDGATVDNQDHLWSAQWGSSRVVRYDPQGNISLCLSLPISQPSCVAIGGPKLDWLIITTARQDLSEQELEAQPLAGDLFIYQLTGINGLVEPLCTI